VGLFFRKQKAAVNDNQVERTETVDDEHASIVAAGTNVTGNIDCDGAILIEGQVRGSVRAMKLTVGLEGAVVGDLSADEVRVRGSVKGPIHARHIHLEAGAEVEGDLTTATISIDTGARLSGAVWQEQPQESQGERYAPITASSWEQLADESSRSLLGARPRINGSAR
jgi:cytoskeletal protein CcmA (bactofilin family)